MLLRFQKWFWVLRVFWLIIGFLGKFLMSQCPLAIVWEGFIRVAFNWWFFRSETFLLLWEHRLEQAEFLSLTKVRLLNSLSEQRSFFLLVWLNLSIFIFWLLIRLKVHLSVVRRRSHQNLRIKSLSYTFCFLSNNLFLKNFIRLIKVYLCVFNKKFQFFPNIINLWKFLKQRNHL